MKNQVLCYKCQKPVERSNKFTFNDGTVTHNDGCLDSVRRIKDGNPIVVLIQGAFEILNHGHIMMFKRLKSLGDILIVALNTNPLLWRYKHRRGVLTYRHKKLILEAIRYIDRVVPAHQASPLSMLKRYKVDVFCLTREWESSHQDSIAYMKAKGGRVFFSRRYKGVIATSEIKKRLLEEAEAEQRYQKAEYGR